MLRQTLVYVLHYLFPSFVTSVAHTYTRFGVLLLFPDVDDDLREGSYHLNPVGFCGQKEYGCCELSCVNTRLFGFLVCLAAYCIILLRFFSFPAYVEIFIKWVLTEANQFLLFFFLREIAVQTTKVAWRR